MSNYEVPHTENMDLLETVTYVSNIYKYYMAYHLIMEAQAAREKAAKKIKSQSK